MQKLCQLILRLLGWKYEAKTPNFNKCVLAVAPHTSNCDFFMGKIAYTALGRNANFVIKKEWMFWPVGIILRKLGGIPIDRSKSSHFTDQITDLFLSREVFNIAITPEGTRKRNPKWKRGFYVIAQKAKVPIVLVKIDYAKKEMSLFDVFIPTGDEHTDIEAIKQKFKGVGAKHPENFVI
jgi:1-acyl-sn-glycerol-3-phosphate acyltransferase